MPDAATIADVLERLDAMIARAIDQGNRIGYFAAIYRQVTAKIAEGIDAGFFDDGERMERLDVVFANRYLAAVEAYDQGRRPTRSWELALRATGAARPLIVQHLLLGMNAHINLDLGVATASVAPGAELPRLRRDFDRINEILAALVAGIEDDLSELSPWIGLLDRLGGRHDEEVIWFSIEVARAQAWRFATELAPLAPDDWAGPIAARDARVAHLARKIRNPGWLGVKLLLIRARESNDVARNIRVLCGVTPPDLETVEARVRQARAIIP
jgi:hypothetical protein